MKVLSESRPLRTQVDATPRRHRSMSFDVEICSDEFYAPDPSSSCEARAGDGDGVWKGLNTEIVMPCSSHRVAEIHENDSGNGDGGGGDDDDDDDDDLHWANARLPLRPAPRNSGYGYGYGKGLYRASSALGKENKARSSRKLASFPNAIGFHQCSGPMVPNSGPFSGPLTPLPKHSFCVKSNRLPSIIPADLLRRKALGFYAGEPMSPKVTCLGRIRCKELNVNGGYGVTACDELCVGSQTPPKGKCFDTKNQLCGKRSKGRKKKEKARRRFASADSKSFSSELVQTRREKAATLARSLTSMLEDMRRVEKKNAHYEPSVPPPNSLLLMRGCRTWEKDIDTDSGSDEDASVDMISQFKPTVPPPNSLLLMRGCRVRGNLCLPQELFMDWTKHEPACTTPMVGDSDDHRLKKLKIRAARHLSLHDLIDKEETIKGEGVSTSAIAQGSNGLDMEDPSTSTDKRKVTQNCQRRATLCQRRTFGDLSMIEVKVRARMER